MRSPAYLSNTTTCRVAHAACRSAGIILAPLADGVYARFWMRSSENTPSRGSFVKRRWVRKVAPRCFGADLSGSIWWSLAVTLQCRCGVFPIAKLPLETVWKLRIGPITGPANLRNGAKRHHLGRFAPQKTTRSDPHSDFPDSLSSLTLAIWSRITSHLLGYLHRPLRTFCGSPARTDPQKVPLQRSCSCWKVHPEKRGNGPQAPLNMVGSGTNLDQCFCGIGERGISIPFPHKWLKSSSRNCLIIPKGPHFGALGEAPTLP
jgi:hypothetical protein